MRTFSDGHSEIFDAVAVIQAFVADKNRTQLELPNLTAVQRKQAKSVVEMHSELSCESLGFGTDRQLHIFKKSGDTIPPVDNMFIDNGIGGGTNGSMFHQQQKDCIHPNLSEKSSELYLASVTECPIEVLAVDRVASPDRSTTASSSSPATGTRDFLPDPWHPEPSLPHGLSVRNTFIDVEDHQTDDRVVQSMPHGMFGHYLKSELSQPCNSESNTLSAFYADSDASALAPGTPVVIRGLQKLPAFNGSQGTIQSFDQEQGRYSILLTSLAHGQQWAKVKPENIHVISPALTSPGGLSLEALDDSISGLRGTADLQGFPSTPGWDDHCLQGHQLFRISA